MSLNLSGDRFSITYRLACNRDEATLWAKDICYEQTVEFPAHLLPSGKIADHIVGRIEDFREVGDKSFETDISYAVETSGFELTQLLNLIFGNISIKPGIRLERLNLSKALLRKFRGPRFGRAGIRKRLGIEKGPLLCAALKPMGLSPEALGDLAYKYALGGLDIIKDDHGLANQIFSPFAERLKFCAAAIKRANDKTGGRAIYMPNLTAPADLIDKNALLAQELGAGGLLLAPGLIGFDTMRKLSEDDNIVLPIFSHPAFLGSFVTSCDSGISHFALFGQLMRLAGADGSIFPNFGGRFSFTRDECISIMKGTETPMEQFKSIFPVAGGGMTLERTYEMSKMYGNEVVFLVGGDLHRSDHDIVYNCRKLREMVENINIS